MLASDFHYSLPKECIAQYPLAERNASRMLVLHKDSGICELKTFSDFVSFFHPGDCLVINDTKVMPARLFGKKYPGNGNVEILLLRELKNHTWEALLRPGRRIKLGTTILLEKEKGYTCQVKERKKEGIFILEFHPDIVYQILSEIGHIPLPPYIRRDSQDNDITRYQTIYAQHKGSVAAPTAGLHLDASVFSQLKDKGVSIVPLTLHIGLGTFRPVSSPSIEEHTMHNERYEISFQAAKKISDTRKKGKAIIAVGTSVVRALESSVTSGGFVRSGEGDTNLFLYPPKKPKVVDRLLTNFHLPQSTLLMLVSTFCSREKVLKAYNFAIENKFRFYSYGDCIFLI